MSINLHDYDLHDIQGKQDRTGRLTINPLASSTNNIYQMNTSPRLADDSQNVVAFSSQINNNFAEAIKQNIRVGTGGSMLAIMMVYTCTTGGILHSFKPPLDKVEINKYEPIYSIEFTLSTIRSSLSINTSEGGVIWDY